MLKTDYQNNTLTAYIEGEIDHDSAVKIRTQVDGAAQSLRPRLLCLDFSNVSFMDSSGIGLVMGRYRLMQNFKGTLEIRNVSAQTKKIMELAGLGSIAIIKEK